MRGIVINHVGHFYMLALRRTQGMSLLLERDRRMRSGIPKTTVDSLFTVRATHSEGVITEILNSTRRY